MPAPVVGSGKRIRGCDQPGYGHADDSVVVPEYHRRYEHDRDRVIPLSAADVAPSGPAQRPEDYDDPQITEVASPAQATAAQAPRGVLRDCG